MDRPTDTVSSRLVLWGVVAPLGVGSCVPPLAGVAMVWLICGLGLLVAQAINGVIRRIDPGEDEDLHAELGASLPVPAAPGRWWHRVAEDPNAAAARAGSWG